MRCCHHCYHRIHVCIFECVCVCIVSDCDFKNQHLHRTLLSMCWVWQVSRYTYVHQYNLRRRERYEINASKRPNGNISLSAIRPLCHLKYTHNDSESDGQKSDAAHYLNFSYPMPSFDTNVLIRIFFPPLSVALSLFLAHSFAVLDVADEKALRLCSV